MFKVKNNQKGVSLIITFFIMIIILAVTFSISALLYSELKIIRNMGNSVVSFYAADSGVEKVLFYDRQTLPIVEDAQGNSLTAVRGLCSLYLYDPLTNADACSPKSAGDPTIDNDSLYCESGSTPEIADGNILDHADGCDPTVCDDCKVSFNTTFDDRTYYVTASITPSSDGKSSIFEINSKGVFGSSERQIKTTVALENIEDAIVFEDACADPKSTAQGQTIAIKAHVTEKNLGVRIGTVTATIKDALGNTFSTFDLTGYNDSGYQTPCSSADCYWKEDWQTNQVQTYYVDLTATDTTADLNQKTVLNIPSCQ